MISQQDNMSIFPRLTGVFQHSFCDFPNIKNICNNLLEEAFWDDKHLFNFGSLSVVGRYNLKSQKPSKTPNVLSWVFVTPKPLTAHTQIERDKNHRLCVSDLGLRSKGCINA